MLNVLSIIVVLAVLFTFVAGILRLLGNILIFLCKMVFYTMLSLFKMYCIFVGALAAIIYYLVLKPFLPFVAKHLSHALTWIIATVITSCVALYALCRKIFVGEKFLIYIENFLPQSENPRTENFLTLIELADSIQAEIVSRFEIHYKDKFEMLQS